MRPLINIQKKYIILYELPDNNFCTHLHMDTFSLHALQLLSHY